MKATTLKKIAALALSVLALMSLFTLCAFAEDVEKDTTPVTDTTVEVPTIGALGNRSSRNRQGRRRCFQGPFLGHQLGSAGRRSGRCSSLYGLCQGRWYRG